MGKVTNVALTPVAAAGLRNQIHTLARHRNDNDLRLGELLYEASRGRMANGQPFYKYCRFRTWEDFVEIETGFSISHANLLRRVHEVFGIRLAGEFATAQLSKVGVTKLFMLRRVVSPKNVGKWLDVAESLTSAALAHAIEKRDPQPLPFGGFKSAHFRLTKTELGEVERALRAVRLIHPGVERQGQLLAELARSFLRGRTSKPKFKLKAA